MNRKIAFLIILLLTVSLIIRAFAEPVMIPVQQVPDEGLTFTEEEALAKATELFAEQGHTYSEEKYFRKAGSVLLPDGQTAWIIFIERREEDAVGNLYTVLSADNGKVIELYYPENDVYTWVMLQWIDEKNRHRSDWSVEEQALFDGLFTAGNDMFDPSQAAVSSDEAVRIASAWAKEHAGIVYDNTSVSYIGHDDDSSHSTYSWVISFERDDHQIMIVYVSTETGEVENSFDMSEGAG